MHVCNERVGQQRFSCTDQGQYYLVLAVADTILDDKLHGLFPILMTDPHFDQRVSFLDEKQTDVNKIPYLILDVNARRVVTTAP